MFLYPHIFIKLKNKIKIVLLVTLCLVVSVLLIPEMLQFDKVKSEIVHQLSTSLAGKVQVSEIRWSWLPFPHLSLKNASFVTDEVNIIVPAVRLYPDWMSFFGKEIGISKVIITHPRITAKVLPAFAVPGQSFFQKKTKVIIEKGTLEIEAQSEWPLYKHLSFQTFSVSADITPESIEFNLISVPSFAGGLTIKGVYEFSGDVYNFDIATERLKLHEAITSLGEQVRFVPVPSEVNLKAHIEGKGLQEMRADIVGDLPCSLVKTTDKELPLTCGFADISLVKNSDDFSVVIKNLAIKEPGISLAGQIKKYLPPNEQEPRWLIDLQGTDMNLSEIRAAVMTLWGDHPVTQIVTSIVLGGTAGKGGYKFDGTVADFEDIRKMTITAENIHADIHVPEVDLDLSEAEGAMLIQDGNLILHNASARLKNSRGRNCSLLLGIPEDSEVFELELDIDADLADLPDTLLQLVEHQGFQKEVKKFTNVSGSATGHLHLGDRLSDIAVSVDVKNIKLLAEYEHLNWGFEVNDGSLEVRPKSVSWQGITGTLGPHQIWDVKGNIQWEDDVQIQIDVLDASVSGTALAVEDFKYFPMMKIIFDKNIDFLDGFLKLSNTVLSGPVLHPEKWKYQTTIDLDGVRWESPFLPTHVTSEKGTLKVSDTGVEITELNGRLFEDSFVLHGKLTHNNFADWQGSVTLSGSVHQDFAQWLKKKDWIPPAFFPSIPCNIKNIDYTWNTNELSLKGIVIPGEAAQERPRLEFSYKSSVDNPFALKLDIFGETERGVLQVDLLDNLPETVELSWQGAISGQTVGTIFEDKNILHGLVQGELNISISPDPQKTYMEGALKAEKLRWYWGGTAFDHININNLQISGKGKEAVIENLTLGFPNGETVSTGGNVFLSEDGLKIDFDLTSPSLSLLTVVGFISDLSIQKDLVLSKDAKKDASVKSWSITGHVNFNINEFISGDKATPENSLKISTLVWAPLVGSFVLHPQGRVVAEISSGRLCCLSATGKWYSDPSMGDSTFSLTSDCPQPSSFENILPCLGFDQDLIVGELGINAKLSGQVNNWKNGSVTITSKQGRILRLRALSNIFKVVNLTDLFTSFEYSGTDDKGFAYNDLLLESFVDNNKLIIEKAVVKGEGLNLFARGFLDLGTLNTDIVVLIAPLKTLDAIVAKVPLVGRVIGGDNATVITIPVGIKGNIRDPEVTILPPSAVGEGLLSIVKNALMLPFHILSPILPEKLENGL